MNKIHSNELQKDSIFAHSSQNVQCLQSTNQNKNNRREKDSHSIWIDLSLATDYKDACRVQTVEKQVLQPAETNLGNNFNSNITQMIVNRRKPKFNEDSCVVCGVQKCRESTDHAKIQISQLLQKVKQCCLDCPQVTSLKTKVDIFYQNLKQQLVREIDRENLLAQEQLNRIFFLNLPDGINTDLLCEIREQNWSQLPNRKLWKMMSLIKTANIECKLKNTPSVSQANFKQIIHIVQKTVEEGLTNFSASFLIDSIREQSISQTLICLRQRHPTHRYGVRTGFQQTKCQDDEGFQWKNLKIKRNIKNLNLNNKKIDDSAIYLHFPKIALFTNIVEIDLRKNNLTHLSCSIFPIDAPQLTVLDLRSNPIGNEGIKKLKKMSQLKQLMVSETSIDDAAIPHLCSGFEKLEILWIDDNRVTEKGALSLCNKGILKVLSAVGNPIKAEYLYEIKEKFTRKGLFYI